MVVTELDVPSPRSSSVDITINILDRNDNRPIFPVGAPEYYSVELKEGEGQRKVIKVEATDADDATYGEIAYSIESAFDGNDVNAIEFFTIDRQNGEIFVTKYIDRDQHFILSVRARDRGNTEDITDSERK